MSDSLQIDDARGAPWRALDIAVVTETWPPEVNGVALTLARLVDGLRGRGHCIQLVRPQHPGEPTSCSAPRFQEFLCRGLPIPRYPELRMGLPAHRALRRLWREARPDVVHIATEGPLGFSALRVARELGLAVTTEFRTNFHAFSRHYGIGLLHGAIAAYLRWFHNRADCTMVPTAALRRELENAGFERLRVVARGIDTGRFDPARRCTALRASWRAGDDDLVLLYVGRLAPEKNLDTLLASYTAINESRSVLSPRVRLVLVGDGPMRPALQRQVPEAVFAGCRTGEDLAHHYASADLFVFPSLTETWGNVTAEALASGLAVLAFDRAAAAQLVATGRNGVLVDPDDRGGFLRAAVRLAANPAEVRGMSRAARESVLALGWDSIVTRVETHMREACSSRMPLAWCDVTASAMRLSPHPE
jgi:glycosyltransferase involved in cell wall biosynthesis